VKILDTVSETDDARFNGIFTAERNGDCRGEIDKRRYHVSTCQSVRSHFLNRLREDVESDVVIIVNDLRRPIIISPESGCVR
jgi:hypothetical protein